MKKVLFLILLLAIFLGPFSARAQNTLSDQQQAIIIQMIDLLLKQVQYLQEQLNILIANQNAQNQAIKDLQSSSIVPQSPIQVSEIATSSPIVSSTTAEKIASTTDELAEDVRLKQEYRNKRDRMWFFFTQRNHPCENDFLILHNLALPGGSQEWCRNNDRRKIDRSEVGTLDSIVPFCEKNPCACAPSNTYEDRIACPW